MTAPICPADGATAVLRDDAILYGRSFGRVWLCPTLGCGRYVGAHPDGRPKGTLADEATRKARIAAHAAFDGWWRRERVSRSAAYRVLAERLGVTVAHIGEMDADACARVIRVFSDPPVAVGDGPDGFRE